MKSDKRTTWNLEGKSGGIGRCAATANRTQFHSINWPVALQTFKRGRWVTIGKIVELDGELVLATAIKSQRGTVTMVSMPVDAIDYAERCGVRWWYYRNDRDLLMRRISLVELRRVGIAQRDRELYIHLKDMEPIPWQRWQYVEETMRLGGSDCGHDDGEPAAEQAPLFENRR